MRKCVKKKSLTKKISAVVLSAGMLLSMGGIGVQAGNSGDTIFEYFKVTSDTKFTIPREKLDYTSSTVKLTSATLPVVVRVYGTRSWSESGLKYDCTYGTPQIIRVSSAYTYLPNMVKENKFTYASLGFTRTGVENAVITGVWSPDSV